MKKTLKKVIERERDGILLKIVENELMDYIERNNIDSRTDVNGKSIWEPWIKLKEFSVNFALKTGASFDRIVSAVENVYSSYLTELSDEEFELVRKMRRFRKDILHDSNFI